MTRGRQAFVTLASLQTLMEQGDEREKGSRSVVPVISQGQIELDHVGFSYPEAGKESLSDISLKIKPGERIGLIGRVASGKSTLGRLICGLYEPIEGSIPGRRPRQPPASPTRIASRSYASSDRMQNLFSGTVRENLLLGARDLDEDRLLGCRNRIGCRWLSLAATPPVSTSTSVSADRVSRAVSVVSWCSPAHWLSPCQLLFLDEPTGAMDTQTERLFIDRLNKAITPEQTLIVSTHRNAMLAIVDRLIVIDKGRIIADGPRDQILAKAGLAGE